ncbi:unnamed protein product [Sympodiomycopsis kandeliae]
MAYNNNAHHQQQPYMFSGNPNVQGQYSDHDHDYSTGRHQQQPPSTFSPPDPASYDDDHHHTSEMDRVAQRTDTYNEKSTYGGAVNTRRDSIWTPEDRHVFFKRSVPARACRSIFCIVIWAIIIIVSVVLLVVTFAKPPNVAVMSISVPDANDFSVAGTSFKANGSVNFAISNPNSFSATIQHLQAHLYDANIGKSVSVGNGSLINQKIKAHDNTTIVFPFDVALDLASDATQLISDVAQQCGLSDLLSSISSKTRREELEQRASNQLKVLLEIDAKISILSVGISIPISQNISIDCPTAALQKVIGSLSGGSGAASGIAGLLGGNSKRDGGVDAQLFQQLISPWLQRSQHQQHHDL